MKISIEVGVKTPAMWQKMINGAKLRVFVQKRKVIRIEENFQSSKSAQNLINTMVFLICWSTEVHAQAQEVMSPWAQPKAS